MLCLYFYVGHFKLFVYSNFPSNLSFSLLYTFLLVEVLTPRTPNNRAVLVNVSLPGVSTPGSVSLHLYTYTPPPTPGYTWSYLGSPHLAALPLYVLDLVLLTLARLGLLAPRPPSLLVALLTVLGAAVETFFKYCTNIFEMVYNYFFK